MPVDAAPAIAPAVVAPTAATPAANMARLARGWDSDLAYSFRRSPVAVVSAIVLIICLGAALFAPWVAPHNPFDLATRAHTAARPSRSEA